MLDKTSLDKFEKSCSKITKADIWAAGAICLKVTKNTFVAEQWNLNSKCHFSQEWGSRLGLLGTRDTLGWCEVCVQCPCLQVEGTGIATWLRWSEFVCVHFSPWSCMLICVFSFLSYKKKFWDAAVEQEFAKVYVSYIEQSLQEIPFSWKAFKLKSYQSTKTCPVTINFQHLWPMSDVPHACMLTGCLHPWEKDKNGRDVRLQLSINGPCLCASMQVSNPEPKSKRQNKEK